MLGDPLAPGTSPSLHSPCVLSRLRPGLGSANVASSRKRGVGRNYSALDYWLSGSFSFSRTAHSLPSSLMSGLKLKPQQS